MNTSKGLFVTGTDTGVGKTWTTLALIHHFQQQGYCVAGMKPVASGCAWDGTQLKNQDARLIQQQCRLPLDYEAVNPYAFAMPVAPHLASAKNPVDLAVIVSSFQALSKQVDRVLVEGVGGWLAPLNKEQTVADLAHALGLPVVLVVAIKLGCINQAQLSYQQIQADRATCVGWFAVCVDADMLLLDENIASIAAKIAPPLLGVFPYTKTLNVEALATHINLPQHFF